MVRGRARVHYTIYSLYTQVAELYIDLRSTRRMKRVGLTIWLLLLAVSTNLYDVEGRSTGPPADEPLNFDLVCNQMTPNSFNHGSPMGGNGGYFIDISPSMSEVAGGFTYVGGQIYTSKFLSRFIVGVRVGSKSFGLDFCFCSFVYRV